MNRTILFTGTVVLVIVAGILLWPRLSQTPNTFPAGSNNVAESDATTVCTMDAKMCPDGSYVGRTGPNCEFARCPGEKDNISTVEGQDTWKSGANKGLMYRYPEDFGLTYTSLVDWPPVIAQSNEPYTCLESGSEISQTGKIEKILVNGREYCKTTMSEGAAGSIYHRYVFARALFGGTVSLTFTTREPQCGNYTDNERAECEAEQEFFDLNGVIDQIVETVEVPMK